MPHKIRAFVCVACPALFHKRAAEGSRHLCPACTATVQPTLPAPELDGGQNADGGQDA